MFAPIIITVRKIMGEVKFNKLRGKAIGLHSQTITNFCNRIGIDSKKRQNFIRLAKSNGKRLGLLV
jgi:hypothetical protein